MAEGLRTPTALLAWACPLDLSSQTSLTCRRNSGLCGRGGSSSRPSQAEGVGEDLPGGLWFLLFYLQRQTIDHFKQP